MILTRQQKNPQTGMIQFAHEPTHPQFAGILIATILRQFLLIRGKTMHDQNPHSLLFAAPAPERLRPLPKQGDTRPSRLARFPGRLFGRLRQRSEQQSQQ
jgi:hypothetical protein